MRQLALSVCISLLFFAFSGVSHGKMLRLGDDALGTVTGRSGISIDLDLGILISMDSFRISDTSEVPNWLELNGITIDNGSGGSFFARTSDASGPIPSAIDVTTDVSGRTMVVLNDSSRISPRYYNVESLVFANQELGSLRIGPVVDGPSILRISAPPPGSGVDGIEFDYVTRLDIGSLKFAYTPSSALSFNGIHLFGSATGSPELDPASWNMTGKFQIGSLSSETLNTATFSAITDQKGVSSVVINLPMQGSARVENVVFGPSSFGPIAMDGINMHRLQLRLTP